MANSTDFILLYQAANPGASAVSIPQTKVMARDANNNVTYYAVGPRGAATSAARWIVEQLIYDANGLYSYSLHSDYGQIADNFLSLTYA